MAKTVTTGFTEHSITAVVFYGLFIFVTWAFGIKIVGWEYLIIFGLLYLAALFPDTDINSKGQDIFYTFFVAVDLYLIFTGKWKEAAILGLVAMFPVVSHHRGWTHSLLAAIILPLPLVFPEFLHVPTILTGWLMYSAVVTGYLSHILLDRSQNSCLRFAFFWV